MSEEKHVIFLGAGASCTSQYPSANHLRLRLTCKTHFRSTIEENKAEKNTISNCCHFFDEFKESISLFREGCFGTVDEFSKLAANKYPGHVGKMKCLMMAALCLHNPEDQFHKSDYYRFVQNLFLDDLITLKNDVLILTFNYDCYLDYLLLRAMDRRSQLSVLKGGLTTNDRNRLTGGFWDINDREWLTDSEDYFNFIKLHGSIGYPSHDSYSFSNMFSSDTSKRLSLVGNQYFKSIPPVVFPWEIFTRPGQFVKESEFLSQRKAQGDESADSNINNLFQTFKQTWEKGMQMIVRAKRVTFIGLSMHPFLEPGLSYLLGNLNPNASVTNVNTDQEGITKEKLPTSSSGLLHSFLHRPNNLLNRPPVDRRISSYSSFSEFLNRDRV